MACTSNSSLFSVFLDFSDISDVLEFSCFWGFLLGSSRDSLLCNGINMVASVSHFLGVSGLALKLFISNGLLLYSNSSLTEMSELLVNYTIASFTVQLLA